MSVKRFSCNNGDALIVCVEISYVPEPAWLEYRSATKVADRLISLDYDAWHWGRCTDLDSRMGFTW